MKCLDEILCGLEVHRQARIKVMAQISSEVERIIAENKRLREALEYVIDHCEDPDAPIGHIARQALYWNQRD